MKQIKYANIAIKLLLFGLFTHYLFFPDLPQYQNKGMAARLVFYPLMVFAIFITYFVVRWRLGKKLVYPHMADLFIGLAFTIDMLGNTLNLFDRIDWWDDLMHLILWAFWTLAIGVLLRMYTPLSKLAVAGLTIGFGAVTNILWELGEYLAFVPNNPLEGPRAYQDTMGDEALSLLGSFMGALIIPTVLWRVARKAKANQ